MPDRAGTGSDTAGGEGVLLAVGLDHGPGEPGKEAPWTDGLTRAVVEVVAAAPGVTRGSAYRLVGPDVRGDLGPGRLLLFEVAGDREVRSLVERIAAETAAGTGSVPEARWEMTWRRHPGFTHTLGDEGDPYLFLVGMDVPDGTDTAGLAAFNAFYRETHLAEVVAAMGFRRAVRWEADRVWRHPEPGCPRFLAAYEGDEEVIRAQADPAGRPAMQMEGPPAWNGRRTAWRLLYRRIAGVSARGGDPHREPRTRAFSNPRPALHGRAEHTAP
ncbi:hypothetical protein [Pseudonocardia pini]|uniref:hypothetical protein n=1 Tax=Pseudonocardia pini TaxID=2758030 RepID=UPI0015F10DC2|nr:hypothetical protein [Pseudonocardia pini]